MTRPIVFFEGKIIFCLGAEKGRDNMSAEKKETLMTLAYQRILEKIVREHMAPGTPLRECRLAKEFHLSPTPIREAFRRLENEGWLQSSPYRGCVLHEYSFHELEELFSLRETIECTLIRFAVKRANPGDLTKIGDVLRREQDFIDGRTKNASGEAVSPTGLDIAFHDAVMTAAHTPGLKLRSDKLQTQIGYVILLNARSSELPEDLASVHEEHNMIFFALRRKWEDIAEALLRKHIRLAWEKYRSYLKACGKEGK